MHGIILCAALCATLCGCGHSTLGRLVGSDRDEHGCIGSAGYTWSQALHDCIRVWEAADRFDEGSNTAFLVFSRDSLYAEIFEDDRASVLCKRVKEQNEWRAISGKERVFLSNGITTIKGKNVIYTKKSGQ